MALAGCTQNAPEKCRYETVETQALVSAFEPNGEGGVRVMLEFFDSELATEPQDLGELKGLKIDHDFLVRNNISIGNTYTATVSTLVKGNCDVKRTVAFHHAFE